MSVSLEPSGPNDCVLLNTSLKNVDAIVSRPLQFSGARFGQAFSKSAASNSSAR